MIRRGRSALAARGRFTVALSGGSTPMRMYEALVERAADGRDDDLWRDTWIFWGDERCVPPDDPRSNYRAARENLLRALPVREENVHRVPTESGEPDLVAREYGARIVALLDGPDPPPRFDLVLLGLGKDGHTASLFPGESTLRGGDRIVAATDAAHDGLYRVTLTPPVLNEARAVIFLVAGEEKADMLFEVLEEPRRSDPRPAQKIVPVRGELLWMVDRGAARRLASPDGPRPDERRRPR
ncbi:MAG: 6-phosphogluconolactonase [Candidatus Eisenbacteria bacterium]|nr:6-phosphogluconolactonase [Candidatus Latescibacterota bacterium]MBD3301158.1 6-phosphogluconolactonase [Candidatus Eisenbacteria bacterium]